MASETWGDRAYQLIHRIGQTLPDDATEKDLTKALKGHASDFICGTSWGQKAWAKAKREYVMKRWGMTDKQRRIMRADMLSRNPDLLFSTPIGESE